MVNLWIEWFSGRESIKDLPADCVSDCTGSGSADDAVDYWVERLKFEAPAWYVREYLKGYGAWDSAELCDHQANLRRLLWLWASNCAEGEDFMYLGA